MCRKRLFLGLAFGLLSALFWPLSAQPSPSSGSSSSPVQSGDLSKEQEGQLLEALEAGAGAVQESSTTISGLSNTVNNNSGTIQTLSDQLMTSSLEIKQLSIKCEVLLICCGVLVAIVGTETVIIILK